MQKSKSPEIIGGWQTVKALAGGAQGIVKLVSKNGQEGVLKRPKGKNIARFLRELATLEKCQDMPGVLKVSANRLPFGEPTKHFFSEEPKRKKLVAVLLNPRTKSFRPFLNESWRSTRNSSYLRLGIGMNRLGFPSGQRLGE